MFCVIPRSALPKVVEDSKMVCKPSLLPCKDINFIQGHNGREVYFDGSMAIVITKRHYLGFDEKRADVCFYEDKFSNFVASEGLKIKIDDQYVNLPCGEALFQMMKAAHSNDWDSFWNIYNADKPKTCKALSREVKNFDAKNWDKISFDIMQEVVRLKLADKDFFGCFLALAKAFQDNNITVARFMECSPKDGIYGIGVGVIEAVKTLQDADVNAPFKPDFLLQKGQNRLGKVLDANFQLFLRCGGADCMKVADFVENYSLAFGKDFYTSMLHVEEDVGAKKLKTDEASGDDVIVMEEPVPVGRTLSK
jgi:ribA/ribD-fused uncharacterized protein